MELATIVTLASVIFVLVWGGKTKPEHQPKRKTPIVKKVVVEVEKPKVHLSEGAFAVLEQMVRIRNSGAYVGWHAYENISYDEPAYDFVFFGISNNQVLQTTWFEIQSPITLALKNFLLKIISHLNSGGFVVLISTPQERRALCVKNGKAVGEYFISENDHDFISFENGD